MRKTLFSKPKGVRVEKKRTKIVNHAERRQLMVMADVRWLHRSWKLITCWMMKTMMK
jgi:hypothetical protein